MKTWHAETTEDVARMFRTDSRKGLTREDAASARRKYGTNVIRDAGRRTLPILALQQFTSPLVLILLASLIATFFLHAPLDALVIAVALVINVTMGTYQEERASLAFAKLRDSQESSATVVRDGARTIIPAADVVPGDLVILGSGARIPADLRLTDVNNLMVNESILTGEWAPVSKDTGEIKALTSLSERNNMAWMGTLVSDGSGQGVVVATGRHTEVGYIAESFVTAKENSTPIQGEMRRLAWALVAIVGFLVAALSLLGLFRGENVADIVRLSIAIAIAVIPAGLPAAVTVVLALGMEAILRRGGLVRNLLAAETLGSTTIILTDKTGTLTEARMQLTAALTPRTPARGTLGDENLSALFREKNHDAHDLLKAAVLASDAFTELASSSSGDIAVRGRPIEQAIIRAGLEYGISPEALARESPRLDFLPFSSSRRFAASLNALPHTSSHRLYVSGAPEEILAKSTSLFHDGETIVLTPRMREHLGKLMRERGETGERLIGIGFCDMESKEIPASARTAEGDNPLGGFVFLGILAFSDPLRADVTEAIVTARRGGARIVMVTGDSPNTARSIAEKSGIAQRHDRAITGEELARMDDAELLLCLQTAPIFARVTPAEKLRIVRVLRNAGETVAMTGDGVNDAPALIAADIGVAVGSGTDVAKEASDIVLLNDSFAVIVAAIEEGRRIIDNMKKIVTYLLATSFSEVFVIGSALVVGGPIPFLPAQILWTNIIEEGFMNFSFAFEPKETDLMSRDPRDQRNRRIVTGETRKLIIILSTITGIFLVLIYFFLLERGPSTDKLRTIMFAALSIDSLFFCFSLKDLSVPLWRIKFLSNRYLLAAFVTSLTFLVGALFFPPLQKLLSLVRLSFEEIMFLAGFGIFNVFVIECVKFFVFRRRSR